MLWRLASTTVPPPPPTHTIFLPLQVRGPGAGLASGALVAVVPSHILQKPHFSQHSTPPHPPTIHHTITHTFPLQVRGPGAGLASAALVAVVPSYISRSVAGSYDLESVAIFALVFVFYLYVKVPGKQGHLLTF